MYIVSNAFPDPHGGGASHRYSFLAPGLIAQAWSEAQALGAAVWLWMQSPMHRSLPLVALHALLLPPIKRRQFFIAACDEQPVFYAAWALFDLHAERRYLGGSTLHLPPQDWSSGDRLWVLDWIAPFGHTRHMARLLAHRFFPRCWGRTLDHRGSQRGLRVRTFRGACVSPLEARAWFMANPAQLPAPPDTNPHRETRA